MSNKVMENRIFVITGLPGSGKSFMADYWSKQWNIPYFDNGFKPQDIVKYIGKTKNNCIIVDPKLVDPVAAENAKKMLNKAFPEHKLEWFYIENPENICIKNIQFRSASPLTSIRNKIFNQLKGFKREQNKAINFIPVPGIEYTSQNAHL